MRESPSVSLRRRFFPPARLGLPGAALVAVAAIASGASPVHLKVDHATLCGSALAPMESAFAEAGLPAVYGGPHATGGTHMALLGFEDGSYLELIAPQRSDASVRESPWGNAMAGDAGPCAWAVGTTDIEADIRRLAALRIATHAAEPGSRVKPDGTLVRWKTATLGKGTRGATLPFLIEDVTPRVSRVAPSPGTAGSGLTGIRIVVVGVKRLEPAIAQFRKAWGWGAPRIESDAAFGARLAYFPGEPVILAQALSKKGSDVAYRVKRFGEGPVAIVLGAARFDAAKKKFALVDETTWFAKKIAWFPSTRLRGARIGVVAP
jgi:hypothetical protein